MQFWVWPTTSYSSIHELFILRTIKKRKRADSGSAITTEGLLLPELYYITSVLKYSFIDGVLLILEP